MERCPICRATLNGAETCRRCRAELRQAQGIEQLASALVGAAMLALAQGHVNEARQLLTRARLLHATPVVQALWRLMAHADAPPASQRTPEAGSPELALPSLPSPQLNFARTVTDRHQRLIQKGLLLKAPSATTKPSA